MEIIKDLDNSHLAMIIDIHFQYNEWVSAWYPAQGPKISLLFIHYRATEQQKLTHKYF